MSIIALCVNEKDNVATIFDSNVKTGCQIDIKYKNGEVRRITANSPIPYGHKIAITDIQKDDDIIKYGEEIGIATSNIKIGDYVHVHNLDSKRGRGDLEDTIE